jgi:hypothetical protein
LSRTKRIIIGRSQKTLSLLELEERDYLAYFLQKTPFRWSNTRVSLQKKKKRELFPRGEIAFNKPMKKNNNNNNNKRKRANEEKEEEGNEEENFLRFCTSAEAERLSLEVDAKRDEKMEKLEWTANKLIRKSPRPYFTLRFLRERKGCPMSSDILSSAARMGNAKMVRYLLENKCPQDVYAAALAARFGHNDILKLLTKEKVAFGADETPRTCWNHRTRDWAKYYHHYDAYEYAKENGCSSEDDSEAEDDDEMSDMETDPDFHICFWTTVEIIEACWDESWMRATPYFLNKVAETGKIELLRYVREVKACPWDVSTTCIAARLGYVDVLAYLLEENCPFGEETWAAAASEHGSLKCLEFLEKRVKEFAVPENERRTHNDKSSADATTPPQTPFFVEEPGTPPPSRTADPLLLEETPPRTTAVEEEEETNILVINPAVAAAAAVASQVVVAVAQTPDVLVAALPVVNAM